MTEVQALLVLNAIPGLTGAGIKKLISFFGSPCKVLQQGQENLLDIGLNSNLVTNIVHFPKEKFLEDEFKLMEQKGVECITTLDESYPESLKSIDHAPLVLYLKGDSSLLTLSSIALVGSRKATYYGLKVAREFASTFASTGIGVVSGMASGIDTASHQGALQTKGKTIAVLGCGLNHIYPKENTRLFETIGQEGLLVSEFPMDVAPLSYNFPRRNRIISGLAMATVIVEAAVRSGALITVDYALAQNKDVFVVPGNIDSIYSAGTNLLIKEGAKLALSAQDVLEEVGVTIKAELETEVKKEEIHVSLSVEEYKIYELIEAAPSHIDLISARSEQEIGVLMGQMLNLELKGVIKQLPGQFYVRT